MSEHSYHGATSRSSAVDETDLLYALSHRQDSTYHCHTSCGALSGMRYSPVGAAGRMDSTITDVRHILYPVFLVRPVKLILFK